VRYGEPGTKWLPITGDWDGDRIDTIGLYDSGAGRFALRNVNSDGVAQLDFVLTGVPTGATPLAGAWQP
jgi:hypothetical protein